MYIETAKTQALLTDTFHREAVCERLHPELCKDLEDQQSRCWRKSTRLAVLTLGKLMSVISSEMFPLVRADERDKIAYYITAELVCCDIHERLEHEAREAVFDEKTGQYVMPKSWVELYKSHENHPMCRYGGWAAALAKEGPDRDTRPDGATWWGKVFEPCSPPQEEIK